MLLRTRMEHGESFKELAWGKGHGAWRELLSARRGELMGNYFFLSEFFISGVNDFLEGGILGGVYNPAFVLGLKKRRQRLEKAVLFDSMTVLPGKGELPGDLKR